MLKATKIAAFCLVAFAAPAHAGIVECTWDYWGGASKPVVLSWLGTKARMDTGRNIIGIGDDDGWYKPRGIEQIAKSGKFVAYVYNIAEKDVENNTYKARVSLRVYTSGKGEMIFTHDGYTPMSARGQCATIG